MFLRALYRVSSSRDGETTRQDVAPARLRNIPRRGSARSVCFAFLVGLAMVTFWAPLSMLIRFSLQHAHYSHIILIPLISASLFFLARERIFSHPETSWRVGSGLLAAGGLIYSLGQRHSASASENDQLSIAIFAVVIIGLAGFVLCYGIHAFRTGLFPVLFLFLMVPIPDFLLNRAIFWLQTGSAEVSDVLFRLVGVPVLRIGFTFALPGLTIEVARECSGIRSSLSLLITSLLAGHLFLRSGWKKTVLTIATVPLLIVKNGIRIVALSLASIYVDPRFMTGNLHRDGGIVFFFLALLILAPVLWLLQRSEGNGTSAVQR
jgi:exosortase